MGLVGVLGSGAVAQSLPEREFGEPWNGLGFGARAIGMAGAYTAIGDDLDGLYWNPGGLVRMRDTQIGVVGMDSGWTGRYNFGPSTLAEIDKQVGVPVGLLKAVASVSGIGFVTTGFKPWATGLAVYRNYHPESALPFQDTFFQGTFVLPMNAARTAGLGLNVKYLHSDPLYSIPPFGVTTPLDVVTGWTADVGLYYSIPMPVRDRRRELNVGMMARNLAGRSRVINTEKIMPSEAQIGVSFVFDDLVPRERSILAVNYDQAIRSGLGGVDAQLRFGFEQRFFQGFVDGRFGWMTPVPRYQPAQSDLFAAVNFNDGTGPWSYRVQGRPAWTAGYSVNVWHLQINGGVVVPAEVKSAQAEKYTDSRTGDQVFTPAASAHFFLGLTWHLGVTEHAPWAKVSVEPLVFAPKKGEVAVFTIDYKDDRGIEFWSVEVKNSARVPVRVYSGRGAPPERLVWDGLDDRFNLTPDDDHTYTLTVRNRDRVETITPPQSLRIFTPGEEKTGRGDDTMIRKVLEENAKREKADKEAVRPLIKGQLQEMKAPLTPGATPPAAVPPEEPGAPESPGVPVAPEPSATSAQGPAAASATQYAAVYRGITPDQILRLEVPPAGTKGDQVVLDYETRQYVLRYLVQEVRSLTEQTFANVGGTAGSFMVQARYGNHLLVVETPVAVARGLRDGRYDEKVWARQAKMSLDGRAISPELD